MARLFNISNFIVSQVNPHIVPFLAGQQHKDNHGRERPLRFITKFLEEQVKIDTQSLARLLKNSSLLPHVFGRVIGAVAKQKYIGNVTVVPKYSFLESFGLNAIRNPSKPHMRHYILEVLVY
jgi:TAG lipase/steryl ester hydrolase/phospholipase A2/LPA acyltransferase